MLDTAFGLSIVHLVAPLILLVPLLTLLPPNPPRLDQPEGVRPITIQRVIPRRGWIISLLVALAATAVLDAAVTVAIFILASKYDQESETRGLELVSWLIYPIGGLVVWALAAVVSEWRGRWHDRGVIILAVSGFILEIPNFELLVNRVIHTTGAWKTVTILSLPPSALRLLLLPVLIALASKPIVRYEAVDTADDVEDEEFNGDLAGSSSSTARQTIRSQQGQIKLSGDEGTSQTPNGAATPGGTSKPSIIIPKKLGEGKRDERVLTWAEVWDRLKKISPHLWPSTSRKLQLFVVLTLLIVAIGRALTPLGPIIFGKLIRALTISQNGIPVPSLWPLFIAFFAIRILQNTVLFFVRNILFLPVTQYTDREMQLLCFNHLLNLSLAYHTRRNTGEVLKVIDRGSAINSLFGSLLFTIAPAIIDLIVGFSVLFALYGGILVTQATVIMILYVWVSIIQTQARVATRRQLSDKDVKQRGIVSDVLTNWESVKYFTAESREVNRYREALIDYQKVEWSWNLNYQTLWLLQNTLLTLGLVIGSLIIAVRISRGEMDAAELVVFIQYFTTLSSPLNTLGTMYAQLNRNSIDAEKMLSLLAEATEVNDKPGAKDLIVTDGVVEFDNVHFSYDGKVDALKGVSFKIEKGTSMALVGESGSGKSTILRLLYRFYDINSGTIRIDGQDISEVTQLSLRRAIGIVPQDSVLWNDTIGANVSYGREGATDEEIINASKAAKLHDKIMGFKDEYATIVGERGIRLSGGEKQRVSLARMFLKSPAILVLDEATSALDTETEREIQRALTDLAQGRTSLSIAHRLSTIINSDQIVVMKDGKVIENGTYKQLLDADAAFATMWKNQIFTEAERLALAQGSGSTSRADSDLIDLEEKPEAEAEPGVGEDHITDNAQADVKEATISAPTSGSGGTPNLNEVQPSGSFQQEGAEAEEGVNFETYAEAVKLVEPTSPHLPPGLNAKASQEVNVDTPAAIDPNNDSAPQANLSASNLAQPARPDPSRRVSFPGTSVAMAKTLSAQSAQSGHSGSPNSRDSTPTLSRQNTDQKLNESRKASDPESKRKRLSSIKGFVRRLSDQGVTRSASGRSVKAQDLDGVEEGGESSGRGAGGKDDSKDNKKKKRLSLR
ncbi:hypothetical protein BD324DRAFT_488296 [Kockovaella imperatae]|uniref:P-loop containing nucleoside triphosphate hydrolase protein n=1 Tax=Kockovaella imperatae TaxID=4999 RepID=A0A1Y1UE46_9TREE|nr:hypothetical protein BD324DRAFT_488296 [Kockovaella imperatae]ORX36321.1 hypothetical protein BD324DRAFT_488296 [Kockovaella imperatae]